MSIRYLYVKLRWQSVPFLGVDIPTCADLDPGAALVAVTRQDARQVILVHQIPLLVALLGCESTLILFLVFCQNEAVAPSSLSAALHFAVGCAGHGFGNAVAVAS